jgi:hypothetical protein
MDQWSVNWYSGATDRMFEKVAVGGVLTLDVWRGRLDDYESVRVLTDPITRTTWHGCVCQSIFWKQEWLDFQIVFGELVYNHQTAFRGEPVWQVYPEWLRTPQPARPAAVVWRSEESHGLPTACVFAGENGQASDEFRREVLAQLPQPLTVDDRFALWPRPHLTVLVAADPSDDRDALVELLRSNDRVIVRTADTYLEVEEHLDGACVVIVADRFDGSPTYLEYAQRLAARVPTVGWPIDASRRYAMGEHYVGLDLVTGYLRAVCQHVYVVMPKAEWLIASALRHTVKEPTRGVYDVLLDAVKVPALVAE